MSLTGQACKELPALCAETDALERHYDFLSDFSSGMHTPREIAVQLAIFAQAYVAGEAAKRIDELQSLVDAYAQRVTDQDTEIAILRQREEVR